jgi:hypothetical protein
MFKIHTKKKKPYITSKIYISSLIMLYKTAVRLNNFIGRVTFVWRITQGTTSDQLQQFYFIGDVRNLHHIKPSILSKIYEKMVLYFKMLIDQIRGNP